MSDRVNTSGYTCSHYETHQERLERENREMKKRIAKLEALLEWHDASEMPEAEGDEYEAIRICNGKMYRQYSTFRDGKWNFVHRTISPVIFWRDLPPMPGKELR